MNRCRCMGGSSGHGPKVAPEQSPQIALWPGGREAAAIISNGVQNELQVWLSPVERASDGAAPWRRLIGYEDGVTNLEMSGDRLFLLSHQNAPTFQVLAMRSAQTLSQAQVLLPADPQSRGRVHPCRRGWVVRGDPRRQLLKVAACAAGRRHATRDRVAFPGRDRGDVY